MELRLELVILPVTDVDKAKAFHETAGFRLDVDHRPGDAFRVVQLTPPGSACSITFGTGMPQGDPAPSRACTCAPPTSSPPAATWWTRAST